jgi:hypothetical protein
MSRPALRLMVGLSVLAALLRISPGAYARPLVPFDLDSQAFRYILSQAGLKNAVTSLDKLAEDPSRSLLVVFGDTSQLDEPGSGRWLRSFLGRGGAVLIATDRGARNPRPWEGALGVQIKGLLVQAHDPNSMYRGSPDCPYVQPMRSASAKTLPQPPVSLPVATNRTSCLEIKGSELTPFLSFPIDCHFPGDQFPVAWLYPFGMGGRVSSGRVLVLADHSIFINGMMLQTDNGNFDFAYTCVQWLLQSDQSGQKRNQAMFIDEGTVFTTFEVPVDLKPDAGPPLVDLANQFIAQMEQEDFLNRFIARHITPRGIFRGLVLLGTLLLLLYGGYRLVRAAYHLEAQVPLVSRRVGQLVAAPAVVDQRHQALLRQGNLWEAARDLARTCFTGLGIPLSPPSPTAGTGRSLAGPARLPRVHSSAAWRQRRALRQTVYQLWRLASSPRPRRISRRRFAQLVNQVEAVTAAVHDGTLRITGPGETS